MKDGKPMSSSEFIKAKSIGTHAGQLAVQATYDYLLPFINHKSAKEEGNTDENKVTLTEGETLTKVKKPSGKKKPDAPPPPSKKKS